MYKPAPLFQNILKLKKTMFMFTFYTEIHEALPGCVLKLALSQVVRLYMDQEEAIDYHRVPVDCHSDS